MFDRVGKVSSFAPRRGSSETSASSISNPYMGPKRRRLFTCGRAWQSFVCQGFPGLSEGAGEGETGGGEDSKSSG